MAVALGAAVYIWNASTGEIVQLMAMEEPEEYISSVKWIKEGNILGVGNSTGNVQVRLQGRDTLRKHAHALYTEIFKVEKSKNFQ